MTAPVVEVRPGVFWGSSGPERQGWIVTEQARVPVRAPEALADAATGVCWLEVGGWGLFDAAGRRIDAAPAAAAGHTAPRRARAAEPGRPAAYSKRLRALARARRLGEATVCWYPAVWVYAGARAWEASRRALADADGQRPLLVLPPDTAPEDCDWGALGAWRLSAADVRGLHQLGLPWHPAWVGSELAPLRAWPVDAVVERGPYETLKRALGPEDRVWVPRVGGGPLVVIEDRAGPLVPEVLEALVFALAAAGAGLVAWWVQTEEPWWLTYEGAMEYRVVLADE